MSEATLKSIPSESKNVVGVAKNAKKTTVIRVVGAIASIGAIYFIYQYLFYVSTDNAQIQANATILSSRVSGFITKVNVEDGQKVKAGDILAEIDAKDYQSRTSQSENEIGANSARVRDAELNYKRIEDLYKAGAVSLQQRDSALANYQELSRRSKALEASFAVTKNSLDDTVIRAPSDGVIAKKSAEVGMLANLGTPLFGFVSNDSRWVVANFKETDLDRLKPGQPVKISVDAISNRTFEGEIESFYPATGAIFSLLPPDNATGNFTKVVQRVPTRIKFKNLRKEDIDDLKAGLSVVVDVKVK
jgi:membrane fusion protein (multidrug efflux system)